MSVSLSTRSERRTQEKMEVLIIESKFAKVKYKVVTWTAARLRARLSVLPPGRVLALEAD